MIDLTDLQEDILTLAVKNPDMTNEEIAETLDCSPNWVSEVRRKYAGKVNENKVSRKLQTVSGTADNPPKPKKSSGESSYPGGIAIATGAWWIPVIVLVQGGQPPLGMWLFMAGGWIGVPTLVFLDSKERGSIAGGLIYTVASVFLPMFSGLVYLHRRA